MHEFALAEDIVKTIEQKVTTDLKKIRGIEIEVGVFAGVVVESLEFGLKLILKEKDAEEVHVQIKTIPAKVTCKCKHQYEINQIFQECPRCRALNRSMNSGTDVIISSVDIAED